MAKMLMEAFPVVPRLDFGTKRDQMARERQKMALALLRASGM